MTRAEVLRKIEDARIAIQEYKKQGLDKSYYSHEQNDIQKIKESSIKLIVEARTIGAAGQECPTCRGSGRV
jgi:hypothetical protein